MSVLIIDDDDLIVEAASEYLMRHHYEVQTARQFSTAKSMMLKRDFDVVMMELHLTGGSIASGMEMVSWIREQFPSIKIGVFTASNPKRVADQARHLGVSTVITKPTTVRKVLMAADALSACSAESSGSTR